jgi:hypothetical protein
MLSVCDWARFMKLLCAHQSQYVRVSLVLRCQFAFEEAALYNIGRFMVRRMPAIKFVSGTFLNDARGKQSELLAIGVVLEPLPKVCGRLFCLDRFISQEALRLILLVVDPCHVPTKYFETVPVPPIIPR